MPMPDSPPGSPLPATVVIGGGIVGLAVGWRLLVRHPGTPLVLLEKESAVAQHQSGHNSGVLHAGLAYQPGSLKARLATDGIRRMTAFCREHGIAHEICGKVVVASDAEELPRLHAVMERGQANGLCDLTWLSPEQLREIEPHAAGVAALRVPEEGIADFPAVCRRLAQLIEELGGAVVTSAPVQGIRRAGTEWIVQTPATEYRAALLINCAGMYSDRIARLAGERPAVRNVPFRGDYYRLIPERAGLVRHLIYPVADPAFPFLGVHLTRRVNGTVDAGPNAVLATDREGYRIGDVNLRDLIEIASFAGLRKFVWRYPAMCWRELRRSFSRELFAAALQKLVPELRADDLEPGGAGVRAQAMAPDGALVHDFVFLERPGAMHVLNAPSPAATASLSIADEVVTRAAAAAG